MLPTRVLLHGKDEPLAERRQLRAGPLTATWENGDLRYIALGDHEILRRVYVAVRDQNWGTVAPVMKNLMMDVGPDTFRITYDVENRQDEICFAWSGAISGESDGTIRFSMDGVACSTFRRNRIGFCVLHPAQAAGAAAQVTHVDGLAEHGHLPIHIVPSQPVLPFAEMQAMRHEVIPGVWAELAFEGEVFEMEDQRNWSDASYKTFGTPLRLPFPVEVEVGTRIAQSITLSLHARGPSELRGDEPLATTMINVDQPQPPFPCRRSAWARKP
jgi:hypothetical protein